MKNLFEEICEFATVGRWCWKIPCTTCGSQDFRKCVSRIAFGKPISRNGKFIKWIKPHDLLLFRDPSVRDKILEGDKPNPSILLETLGSANLERIRKFHKQNSEYKYDESWLGFLGVTMHLTEQLVNCAQLGKRETVVSLDHSGWRKQLDKMLGRETVANIPLEWIELTGYHKKFLAL